MIDSGNNAPPIPDADRVACTALQREIVAAMRAGRQLSQAHKEGGTTIGWERDRFVIEDYGEWESRREFTDESAFLDALWRRYDWMISPGRGEQRRTELEAWSFILHELRRDRFAGPTSAGTTWSRFQKIRMYVALLVLVLAMIGFGAARLLQVRTIGAPFGQSARAGDSLATLVRTQERYIPSLHRNPDRDRFRIDLMLTPLMGDAKPRLISLARDLQRNAFHPGTRILGVDGPLLWMMVPELKALDLRTSRVITLEKLRAANPALDEIWYSARFHFSDRLHLMSPDRQRAYTIDPETLRAQIDDDPPRLTWREPDPTATSMLCLGAPMAADAWVFLLSETECTADFRVGSSVSPDKPVARPREPRLLHRVEARADGGRLRIANVATIAPETYMGGAFVRAAREAGALQLSGPDGFLLAHRVGTTLEPRFAVTRVGMDGKAAWTVDTGLRELDQILPEAARTVFIGRLPAPEGRIPEPVAVVVNTANGTFTTRSLRP